MKRVGWLGAAMALVALPLLAQAPATLHVVADGAVGHPGSAVYAADARLSTVALAVKVDSAAYMLGAAWLQPSLQRDQLRLHAGLLYELGAVYRQAVAAGNIPLTENSAILREWLSRLPVTGRRTGVALDPARLEVTPAADWPVHEGDRLFYPQRPADIRVVGAVDKACSLPHVALRDARRYLADCPVSRAADPDVIYVVQPDGVVFEQNIALWNRAAPRPLAPGAWIYVPLDRKAIAGAADETFNRDFADFLGTQLLDEAGLP